MNKTKICFYSLIKLLVISSRTYISLSSGMICIYTFLFCNIYIYLKKTDWAESRPSQNWAKSQLCWTGAGSGADPARVQLNKGKA